MKKNYSLGISSLLASTVLFADMGALVKLLHTQGIDSYKVALFRFAIGISLLGSPGACQRAGLITADRCLRADQGVAEEKVAFSATLTRRNTEMRCNHRQPEGLWLRTAICGFKASR